MNKKIRVAQGRTFNHQAACAPPAGMIVLSAISLSSVLMPHLAIFHRDRTSFAGKGFSPHHPPLYLAILP
jgi:hypothetical protein